VIRKENKGIDLFDKTMETSEIILMLMIISMKESITITIILQ